jgi:hypothetical protein
MVDGALNKTQERVSSGVAGHVQVDASVAGSRLARCLLLADSDHLPARPANEEGLGEYARNQR